MVGATGESSGHSSVPHADPSDGSRRVDFKFEILKKFSKFSTPVVLNHQTVSKKSGFRILIFTSASLCPPINKSTKHLCTVRSLEGRTCLDTESCCGLFGL